jgi:hypothetical protein
MAFPLFSLLGSKISFFVIVVKSVFLIPEEDVLNKAAKHVIDGDADQSVADIEEGKSSLQKLLNKYGEMASTEEKAKTDIIDYAKSLMRQGQGQFQYALLMRLEYRSRSKPW